MARGIQIGAALLLPAVLLSGCRGSTEDRINAAVPVSKEVEAAKHALETLAQARDADTKAFAGEYQSRLKIRALECSHGYQPSLLSTEEAIRKAVGNAVCFSAADQKLQQWLGMRRIGLLLAMPPLRAVPERVPAMLVADEPIQAVVFADSAGIAVAQWSGHYQVFDLNTGKAMHAGELSTTGQLSLSVNGRLLVAGGGGDAQVRETETGDVLTTLPDVGSGPLFWLDSRGAVYAKPDSGGLVYLDLASGREIKIPMTTQAVQTVLPVSGSPPVYALLSFNRMATMELVEGAQGWEPQLIKEVNAERDHSFSRNETAVSADGKIYFSTVNSVQRLTLATLESQSIAFQPMRVQRVLLTGDPDRLLITSFGSRASGYGNLFLYSISKRTLAKVDRQALLSDRLIYIPALRSNAVIDGTKIVPVKELATDAPVAIDEFLDKLAWETQLAVLDAAERNSQLAGRYPPVPREASSSRYNNRSVPAARTSFAPGRAGLVEAVRSGVLRTGNSGDVAQWKRRYESKTGKSLGREFDERIGHQSIYVITGDFAVPSGLHGAHAVVFVLESRAPFPRGDPGHSVILDVSSGSCSGPTCMIYVGGE